jgi:phosphodiesterase/alkaline phosphatase D-like protein
MLIAGNSKLLSRSGANYVFLFFRWIYPCISLCVVLSVIFAQVSHANEQVNETEAIIVASGDTTQTSTIIWARSSASGPITVEVYSDPDFSEIVLTAEEIVTDALVPVKLEITGLSPATQYYYRVTDSDTQTRSGRFRTATDASEFVGLHFGASGDWQQAPPFPTLVNIPERDLEFFIKLGDTIYADLETPALPGKVQARTLADFRTKQNENISGRFGYNFMNELYSSTSILAVIDDHEIVDNFAGGASPGDSPDAPDVHPEEPPLFTDPVRFVNETLAYKDAMQAFHEYHPIKELVWRTPIEQRLNRKPKLYRYLRYGSDAAVFILDTRSFRDAQLPPVVDPINPEQVLEFLVSTFNPKRTLLGRPQFRRLRKDLLDAERREITWKFIVVPEPIQNFGPLNAEDRFEGYAFERTRLLSLIKRRKIKNVVFLSADFHGTIVNNLAYQWLLPFGPSGALMPVSIPIPAFEIVSGPVAFFNGRLGPVVVNLAAATGLITSEELAFYNNLPVAPDIDSEPDDKDDFVKNLVNAQLSMLQYDPIGLNDNLPQAEGLVDAELLAGDYFATHDFTWTEFEIDAETQDLLVTVWGTEAFSEEDLQSDPDSAIIQEPFIISQFVVHPQSAKNIFYEE